VVAYRATVDVPGELAQFTAKLLAAERRRRGTPRGSRALTCFCRRCWGCGGSATAPPPMPWPAITASRGPPPTGTWTRCSPARCRQKTSASAARPSTCGTPARPMSTAATSRRSWLRTGSRCGSPGPNPDRCTTSPPPASTPCPRCTGLPPPGCQPWPTRDTMARASASTSRSTARRRAGPRYRHPHPQRAAPLAAPPGRTRVRAAHRPLAHPAAHHRQPRQDRRYRPGRPRPHPFRTRLHQNKYR